MEPDRIFHNGQPQPGAAKLPAAGFVHAVEAFEDPLLVLRRNPRTVIADADHGFAGLCGQFHLSGALYLMAFSVRLNTTLLNSAGSPDTVTG